MTRQRRRDSLRLKLVAGPGSSSETAQAITECKRAVGSYLKEMREAAHLTQQRLAELCEGDLAGLSRQAIGAIERGEQLPGVGALVVLSRVLRFDPREVLAVVERHEAGRRAALHRFGARGHVELREMADRLAADGHAALAAEVYDDAVAALSEDASVPCGTREIMGAELRIRQAESLRRARTLLPAAQAARDAICRATTRPEIQARAYCALSRIERERGYGQIAEDAADRAVALSQSIGPDVTVAALMEKGLAQKARDRHAEAWGAFAASRKIARTGGELGAASLAEGQLALCAAVLHRHGAARSWLRRAISSAQRANQPGLEARWIVELARVELDAGRPAEAEQLAFASLGISRPWNQWTSAFRAEWLLYRLGAAAHSRPRRRQRPLQLRRLHMRVSEPEEAQVEMAEFEAAAMGAHPAF